MIGSARLLMPLSLKIVSCNIVFSLKSDKYCLGYSGLDSGQRRVPEPPERITGVILDNMQSSYDFQIILQYLL